jgi:hypothetical protein
VGGGRQLIISGLPYGEENRYVEGAPEGLPLIGDPGVENRQFLIQRSAEYFVRQNKKEKGKMVVAHKSSTDEICIVAQEDGADGFTLDKVRDFLVGYGYDNALAFDGSDSTLLVKDDKKLIDNDNAKDKTSDSGITFSVPCQ